MDIIVKSHFNKNDIISANSVLNAFNKFAVDYKQDAGAISHLSINRSDGSYTVTKASKSCYEKRSDWERQIGHNRVRELFFEGIARQFGGAGKIPPRVLKEMYQKDVKVGKNGFEEAKLQSQFESGKPLKSHHIKKIMGAIKTEMSENKSLRADQFAIRFENALRKYDEHEGSNNSYRGLLAATQQLFKAALPPDWKSAKHIVPEKLTEFGAQNIKELEEKINDTLVDLCDLNSNMKTLNEFREQIKSKLQSLADLFEHSHKHKGDHVKVFLASFENISKSLNTAANEIPADQRNYTYEKGFKTYDKMIESYSFEKNRPYDINDSKSSRKFVQDMLYVATKIRTFDGDNIEDYNTRLLNWMQEKLQSTLKLDPTVLKPVTDTAKMILTKNNDPIKHITMFFRISDSISLTSYLSAEQKSWLSKVQSDVNSFSTASSNVTAPDFSFDDVPSSAKSVDVESEKNVKLETLLKRFGVTSKLTSHDRLSFNNIAQCAFGSREGHKGGAGYIGLFPDGTAFKFLTNFSERGLFLGSGMSRPDKIKVNSATQKLRAQLEDIAEKCGPRVKAIVSKLLAPKINSNGLDLLFRTDVAKAIDCMAPYIIDNEGNKGEWKELTATAGTSYSSLRAVARETEHDTQPEPLLPNEPIAPNEPEVANN